MDYIGDKSWMYGDNMYRFSEVYEKGVECFTKFAFQHRPEGSEIISYPCYKCDNRYYFDNNTVQLHLVKYGFTPNYANWCFHGETRKRNKPIGYTRDDMHGMINDAAGNQNNFANEEHTEKFEHLLAEANEPLYPGCEKYSKLSFIVRLYQMKCLNGWSNKSFSSLLQLLKDVFPKGNTLPKSYYATKRIMADLGLNYHKIDACPNDCMLYWKDHAKDKVCSRCGASRWKPNKGNNAKKKNVPAKILRHFPLIPRLQRLFMSPKTAELMRWHKDQRVEDGLLRHPADCEAWKDFDTRHLIFGSDSRNVRLGLASDGFSPFKMMAGNNHSTWPVVLMPYNLPPWLCMKQPYFMLSLIIDGPKSPGNDIDVYLQPLIEELQILWKDGVDTYDASKAENFRLHAAIMWTINDFSAYGMLSGWTTRGYMACPYCHIHTGSEYLKNGRKNCFMKHRRWLPCRHPWREDKDGFDVYVK